MAAVPDLADPTKPLDPDLTIKPSGHLQRVVIWDYNATTGLYTPRSVLASGSATAGAPGSLAFGAAATASPTLTNGLNYPFSFTLKGGVRGALIDAAGTELDYSSPTQVADFLPTLSDTTRAAIGTAVSGDNTIIAAVAAQTVRVHRFRLHAVAAVTVLVKDGAGTTLETIPLAAGEKFALGWSARPHYFTSSGNALILNLSGALQIYGRIEYVQS